MRRYFSGGLGYLIPSTSWYSRLYVAWLTKVLVLLREGDCWSFNPGEDPQKLVPLRVPGGLWVARRPSMLKAPSWLGWDRRMRARCNEEAREDSAQEMSLAKRAVDYALPGLEFADWMLADQRSGNVSVMYERRVTCSPFQRLSSIFNLIRDSPCNSSVAVVTPARKLAHIPIVSLNREPFLAYPRSYPFLRNF